MQEKILFISYDGMTDPLGQSQVIPYLQGLSQKGYYFYIVSCEKKTAFNKNKELVKKMLEGYSIEWHPVPYTKKPPVFSTLKDIVLLRKKAIQLYRQHAVDMVHTRPGIPALIGLMMKKKFGVKFLHDIREFYADSRVDGGIWNIKNPLYKIIYNYFKSKEKQELQYCDGIVCLTKAAEKIIKEQPGYKNHIPLKVIPCSVDLNLFNPAVVSREQQAQLKKELGIASTDFIVSYLGSIGGWYLTTEMMQFCKLLLDKQPAAKFLFISPHLHEVIATEANKHGLPADKIIVQHGKRHQVPALLSLSNYALFFIKPCFSKLSSSPTKHGEIMAMGIPVITNSGVGDVQEIVEKQPSGFVVDQFTETAFSAVINKMIKEEQAFNQADIRSSASEYYSLTTAIEWYASLYKEVLHKKNGL